MNKPQTTTAQSSRVSGLFHPQGLELVMKSPLYVVCVILALGMAQSSLAQPFMFEAGKFETGMTEPASRRADNFTG